MTQIAELSSAEMRLLLRYIQVGNAREPVADTMAMTGVIDRGNFYRARKGLRDKGIVDQFGLVWWAEVPIVIETTPAQSIPEPFHPIGQGIHGRPDLHEDIPIFAEKSWTQKAMDADLNGDQREQVSVLREAFQDILGQELTARSAKILLGLAGGYAEDLIGEFEAIRAKPKKIDYPFSYLKKKLESETVKTLTAKPATRVMNTDLPDVVQADIGPEPDFYLDKPTARTAELERKMAALGLFDDDEEDD